MTEVSFHKELYEGEAVDEAAKTYDRFATLERVDETHRWLVRVTAASPEREARIANELSNFALGITIERANGSRAKGSAG